MTIRRMLQKLDPKINVTFGKHNTMKQKFFSKIKDPTPKEQNSGVVYKVPCSGCPKVYVGETSQLLELRVSQHKKDVEHRSRHTALAKHAYETGHRFAFEDTTIVGRENNMKKRKILEVVNIVRHDTVNFKTDTENLCTVYKTMIRDYA